MSICSCPVCVPCDEDGNELPDDSPDYFAQYQAKMMALSPEQRALLLVGDWRRSSPGDEED